MIRTTYINDENSEHNILYDVNDEYNILYNVDIEHDIFLQCKC
jgi:hypothetical protein